MTGRVFHLILHTHWDREWYLPLGAFGTRLVRMVDDLIDRLEGDPGFTSFLLDGQAILLDDYLEVRPERRSVVAELVGAGRLQAGPWYVLADEQIPAGESVIRNLLAGRSAVRRVDGSGGVLYSPDAFGHPAVLPQIGHEFGLTRGVVWRGLGVEARNQDLVWWEGPDGRRALIYHLPPGGYEIGGALPADRKRLPAAWKPIRASLVARAATRHVAVFVGADHHWAHPNPSLLRELLAEVESPNEVLVSRLEDFLAAAESDLNDAPVIRGELRNSYGYTWTLQGQHGTRTPLKRRSSALELSLARRAEPLSALASRRRKSSSGQILQHAWRQLLACHFHDAICGTCSDDVARALETRFTDVEATVSEVTRDSLFAVSGHDPDVARERPAAQSPSLVVWNPAARPRGGVVTADLTFFKCDVLVGPPGSRKPRSGPGYRRIVLRDSAGLPLPLQILDVESGFERLDAKRHYPDLDQVDVVRVAVAAGEAEGLTVRRFDGSTVVGRGSSSAVRRFEGSVVKATAGGIKSGLVDIALAPDGTMSLTAKAMAARFNGLSMLESGGDVGDTYSFCPPRSDRIRRLSDSALNDILATSRRSVAPRQEARVSRRVTARGPILGRVEITGQLRCGRGEGRGLGYVDMRLGVEVRSGEPLVRLTLDLDNQARDHRLRLRFPTGLRGIDAMAGAQFGTVRRAALSKQRERTPMEQRVATAPAQRFVAVADGDRGLAIFTPGFFEYELTPEGDVVVTVLRAIGELSKPGLVTRPGHAGWPTPTPLAQCVGLTRMELAVAAVTAADIASPDRLERLWEDSFVGLEAHWIRDLIPEGTHDSRPTTHDCIELSGEGVVFSTMKQAESGQGIVLRCFNSLEKKVQGRWRLGSAIAEATRCRADETPLQPCEVTDSGREIVFEANPRELVTIQIAQPST